MAATNLAPAGAAVLVMAGRSNSELSADLGLARQTSEAHLSRLLNRFDVTTRTELGVDASLPVASPAVRWIQRISSVRSACRIVRAAGGRSCWA